MTNYPKINNNDIKVLGRVVTIASNNKLAAAEQIFDETFQYSGLPRYSINNIDETLKGLDQYTINRLFGKKFKALDFAGIVPDIEGWLNNIKVKALTVANNLTVLGDATVNNLNVTNRLVIDGTDINERLEWLTNVVNGVDKDNAIWAAIINLRTDLDELREDFEECCNEVKETLKNLPTGGGVTISCDPDPIVMTVGDPDKTLSITSNPALAGNPTITSNNTSVATIVGGKVHAVAPGNTTVTITWQGQQKNVDVIINEPEEVHEYEFTVNPTSATAISGGNPITVVATPTDNGTPMAGETISWASNNSTVATVSNGVVTPKVQGTATITAMWNDPNGVSHRATCDVTVNTNTPEEPDPYALEISDHEYEFNALGESLLLTVSQNSNRPEGVTWASSNESVATFTSRGGDGTQGGYVKIVGYGTATITCTGNDSGLTDSCVVTLNNPQQEPTPVFIVTPSSKTMYVGEEFTFTAELNGTVLDGADVLWGSREGDENYATYADDKGKVHAIAEGTFHIIARYRDAIQDLYDLNSDLIEPAYATVTIVRNTNPETVTISGPDTVRVNQSIKLTATVTPQLENELDANSFVWACDSQDVHLSHNDNSALIITVTGWAETSEPITITGTAPNGGTASHQITVLPASVTPTHWLNYMDGEDAVSSVQVEEGATITPMTITYQKEGYEFAGWDGMPSNMKMPANDLTVYAIWEEVTPQIDFGWQDNEITIHVGESVLGTTTQGENENITGAAFQIVTQPNATSYPIQLGTNVGGQPDGTSLQVHITGVNVGDVQVKTWPYLPQELPDVYDILTVHVIEPDSTTFITVNGPDTIPVGSEAVVYTSDVTLGSDNYLNTTSNVPNIADWTIADSSIIKVNDDYKLSTDPIDSVHGQNQIYIDALTEGTTTITARSTQYPGIVITKTVTVTEAVESVEPGNG